MTRSPLAFSVSVTIPPPSPSEKTADAERLREELRRGGLDVAAFPLAILRRLSAALRENNFRVRLVIGFLGQGYRLLDITRDNVYGLALDIGSTNIECSLFDLDRAGKIGGSSIVNPQVRFGPDVLTRVQRSMLGDYEILHEELLEGINSAVISLCEQNGISAQQIYAVTLAGNTIMTHFALGLEVNHIPVSPYIPVLNGPLLTSAGEVGLAINRSAVIYAFPNAGSYVGGDIISGIVYSGLYREDEPALFIDVGTNVEITLGCRDWIMVGAGAAGPALEGGVAAIGRKADRGTIRSVRIHGQENVVDLDVMGDAEPVGICGSGLIDLVSELFANNIIDQSGRFVGRGNRVVEHDGEKAFLLDSTEASGLFLTEKEIQNFLLSKAAMFSFLYVFVRSVGLTFSDIKKIYIAGSLGCGINLESAISIGMLPDIPRERFIPVGNSSLGGAEMLLLDSGLLSGINDLLPRITYREMNEDNELMRVLQGALFIPHTDPDVLKG